MPAGLKGTDYVLRAYALTFSDFGRVALSALGWMTPALALGMWATFGPGGLTDPETMHRANAAMAEAQRTGLIVFDWRAFLLGLLYACFELMLLSGFAIQRHRDVLKRVMPMERGLFASLPPFVGYWLLFIFLVQILPAVAIFVLSGVVMSSPIVIPDWLSFLLIAGVYLAFASLVLRSALIFPAIAIGDREMTVRKSFDLTSGSFLRMLLSLVFIALPLYLVIVLIFMAAARWAPPPLPPTGGFPPPEALWPWLLAAQAVIWIFVYLGTAIFVAYISLVFARLQGGPVPTPANWDGETS